MKCNIESLNKKKKEKFLLKETNVPHIMLRNFNENSETINIQNHTCI